MNCNGISRTAHATHVIFAKACYLTVKTLQVCRHDQGKPQGKKIGSTLDFWIYAEGGGGRQNPKLSRTFSQNLFFNLSLEILKERGGEVKSKPYEEPFQLKFGHFPRKGRGADQIPNFLRNFCLLEMGRKNKSSNMSKETRGEGGQSGSAKTKS